MNSLIENKFEVYNLFDRYLLTNVQAMALKSMLLKKPVSIFLFFIFCHNIYSLISENIPSMSTTSAFAVNDEQRPNTVDGTGAEGASASESASLPLLPESSSTDTTIPSIKLGETIRFEEMGPVIINSDGTTRRISNWDSLTKQEQEATWRRISKRNEERRKMLLEQQMNSDMNTNIENDDNKDL
jgi:hypothetical protein